MLCLVCVVMFVTVCEYVFLFGLIVCVSLYVSLRFACYDVC